MNRYHQIDKKLQNDFLLNIVRSQKRPFAKWVKAEKSEDLECIKQIFGFSESKAREAVRLLSKEQIQKLKEQTDIGGLRK
jgi:predicted transcriptional regulator